MDPQLNIEDQALEGEQMEEMLDAFFDMEDNVDNVPAGDDRASLHSQASESEDVMQKLARLPLYNGSKISVLRASLAMLNLQSIYGWSDASVTALFKLLKEQVLPERNKMPPTPADAKKLHGHGLS